MKEKTMTDFLTALRAAQKGKVTRLGNVTYNNLTTALHHPLSVDDMLSDEWEVLPGTMSFIDAVRLYIKNRDAKSIVYYDGFERPDIILDDANDGFFVSFRPSICLKNNWAVLDKDNKPINPDH
jgi:hypothetical protein